MTSLDESSATLTGGEVLNTVRDFIARFVVLPSPAALNAVTLWVAHTHLIPDLCDTPRLALLSPEYSSGKSRTLEILELLVAGPMLSLNASTAAIFRSLAKGQRTLLFDEVDAIFGRSGKDDPSEDIRALLNAGYRRGAVILRCEGPSRNVVEFPVFAATALASKGDLPDSVMSRSIIIRMRKRLETEPISKYRSRRDAPDGHRVRETLASWCSEVCGQVSGADPEMPDGMEDRMEDVWSPLLAIADAAGGHWPRTSRTACVELIKVVSAREVSVGVRLLGDLRETFGDSPSLTTESLLASLNDLDESPWRDLGGKPLDARRLARILRQYEITSTKIKSSGKPLQGYRREDLWDAWARYLPLPQCAEPEEPPEPTSQEVP
jgi:hypothetical protein